MISSPASGLEDSMESVGEGGGHNILQGDDQLDEMEDDFDDEEDEEEVVLLDDEEFERQLEADMAGGNLPEEVNEYLRTLQAQTDGLAGELDECDDLLAHTGPRPQSDAVVLYEEVQELERQARAQGMTVDDYRRKLVEDAARDDFGADQIEREMEEFLDLQTELAHINAQTASVLAQRLEIPEFKPLTADLEQRLAIEAPSDRTMCGTQEMPDKSKTQEMPDKDKTQEMPDKDKVHSKDGAQDNQLAVVPTHTGALVAPDILSGMRAFIHDQLRATELWYNKRRDQLEQSIQELRQAETQRTARQDGQKKAFLAQLEEDERALMERKEEWERRVERETRERDEQVMAELASQQAEVERVSVFLEEERQLYQSLREQMEQRDSERRSQAAVRVQRMYRGWRSRRENRAAIAEMSELRALRKKERHDLRVMELEYEIQHREELQAREKEEQERQKEKERQRKEEEEKEKELEQERLKEEERIREELRKEKERKMEEERLEEERKKKELEEQKKEEERKRKEEEKQRKAEEKRRKEEEKKQKEEEKKRLKEEEKKRKEEEKKKQEEEKKRLKEEERRKKEEEKVKTAHQAEKTSDRTDDESSVGPCTNHVETETDSKEIGGEMTPTLPPSHNADTMTQAQSNGCVISPPDVSLNQSRDQLSMEDKHMLVGALPPKTLDDDDGDDDPNQLKTSPDSKNAQLSLKNRNSVPNESSMKSDKEPLNVGGEVKSPAVNSEPNGPRLSPTLASSTPQGSTKSSVQGVTFAPQPPPHPPPDTRTPPPRIRTPVAQPEELALPPPEPPRKPDLIERLRLDWMAACLPWSKVSNEPWKLKASTQRPSRRPGSARKLSPLDTATVLTAAQAQSLREVWTVQLTDLPGCSLATLGQCWSLRYLSVRHGRLTTLDGLGQCRHLLYVDAGYNQIEYLDVKDLGSLQVLLLSHNKLSVIHGLEGCTNLRWLDLSHNRITRIGGLHSLRRLHSLDMSHNQLASGEGLQDVVTLQHLCLDHNFLQHLPDCNKLCLLTHLHLSSNNLREVPCLPNQVLLQTLSLAENSLVGCQPLAHCWLPLLARLSLGHNMLASAEGLRALLSLSHLDLSHNQITDLESLTSDLPATSPLTSVTLEGNPLVELYPEDYRSCLHHKYSSLTDIDGQPTPPLASIEVDNPQVQNPEVGNPEFVALCEEQSKLQAHLWDSFNSNLSNLQANPLSPPEAVCSAIFNFCDLSFKMACEHRTAHEYGDLTLNKPLSNPSNSWQTDKSNSKSANSTHKFDLVNSTSTAIDSKSPAISSQPDNLNFDTSISKSNDSKLSGGFLMSKDVCSQSDNQAVNKSKSKSGSIQPSVMGSVGQKAMFEAALSASVSDTPRSELSLPSSQTHGNSNNSASLHHLGGRGSLGNGDLQGDLQGHPQARPSVAHTKPSSSSLVKGQRSRTQDSSDSDDGVDVTAGIDDLVMATPDLVTKRSLRPSPASYMNEKDKFEMALHSKEQAKAQVGSSADSWTTSAGSTQPSGNGTSVSVPSGKLKTSQRPAPKDFFHQAVSAESPGMTSAKDKFTAALQNDVDVKTELTSGPVTCHPARSKVTADLVGSELAGQADLPGLDYDGLAAEFDLDGLDFDIDKYLDMGGLEEVLEQGWRPDNTPDFPSSAYPVLSKIPSGEEARFEPPASPTQAWRDGAAHSATQSQGVRPSPLPLPSPSPAPSSVDSAAETLGGGSVKGRREELYAEWGFKDERTAELMLARAKKMKYNAERKRRISKMDPQQRYQLFRRLQESGRVPQVRPPPARVLPRKEYFQAREEEAQRQECERRAESNTRANRTFEWLHTQVGDYSVSSSRINPGPALYANSELHPAKRETFYTETRTTNQVSPDPMDSVSNVGANMAARRRSSGDHKSQTPTLPPIQGSSAPCQGERISWRDAPVDRSGGWGGGRRRKEVVKK